MAAKTRRSELSKQQKVLFRSTLELWRAARLEVGLYALLQVVQGVIPAATLYLTKLTVDGVVALAQGQEASIGELTFLWVIALAVGAVVAPVAQVLQGNAADKCTAHINLRLMDKSRDLAGLEVLEDARFYDDLNVLQSQAPYRPMNLLVTLAYLLRGFTTLLSLAAVLLALGWWVPLLVLAGSLPQALVTYRLRRAGWNAMVQSTPEARAMAYDQRVALTHAFAHEVRLYGLLEWLQGRYLHSFRAYHRTLRKSRNDQAFKVLPYTLLSIAGGGSAFAWTAWQAQQGSLGVGALVVVVQGLTRAQSTVLEIIDMFGLLAGQHLAFFEKYLDFLAVEPGVRYPEHPRPLPALTPEIAFENVSFRYPDGRAALEGVSFRVRPGETVALVGENGAGKTTLVKLLLRFYDVSEGRVLVGGLDLRELDLREWRRRVGAVFQDFGRYAYTVRENITLAGLEHARDLERLERAVLQAGFERVVDQLPQGLDTRLGKEFDGTELSGGQWQKLAIARALFRDAQVLILDEPTAALDPRSESAIYERFAEMARGRTTLLITHRLASVRMADRILVLKQGRLIEEGSHEQLLALGGEYAELWRMQAEKYAEPAELARPAAGS
ncbi:ABC transporter ATP-binding protein [Calidithermus chliarophilus]|uniref:ABC transporter ATP-binding protein n=1 Tax=Calidithermus chliarophilus TaxID=52023 RepID=UPI0004836412|nr:ABC transporter ATP-binding protein [Calidithermus chliarophilus]